jgi:hypothetical protein
LYVNKFERICNAKLLDNKGKLSELMHEKLLKYLTKNVLWEEVIFL